MPFSLVKACINPVVKTLCCKPYYGHPRGCPNHGKRKGCPPHSIMLYDIFDTELRMYAIWNVFDFAKHCARMRKLHPSWSRRQIECCLYWQPRARAQLRREVEIFHEYLPGYTVVMNPESLGVDVTTTMLQIGQKLEWPPITKTYQVALAGVRNENTSNRSRI